MFDLGQKHFVKINTNNNVNYRLKVGETYYMHLPKTNVLVHLVCSGIAIRAADFKIKRMSENGKRVKDSDNCTFGYQFDNYDSVYFTSFKYREMCDLYYEQQTYISSAPIDSFFLDDDDISILNKN